MIEGELPFLNQNSLHVSYLIATNGTSTIVNPDKLSFTLRDYLAKTLEVDAEKRPDATQLLQHPFFAVAEPLRTLASLAKSARLHDLSPERPYDTPSPLRGFSPSPPQPSRSRSRPRRMETPAPEPAHSRPYTRHPPVRIPPDNRIRRAQEEDWATWEGKYN